MCAKPNFDFFLIFFWSVDFSSIDDDAEAEVVSDGREREVTGVFFVCYFNVVIWGVWGWVLGPSYGAYIMCGYILGVALKV